MAAKGKRAPKTNVFWSKDRILFRHFTHVISMYSFNNIVIKVGNCLKGRDHLFDWKLKFKFRIKTFILKFNLVF